MEDYLKARRKQLGLSRSELGALLGVSGSQVGYWERSELVPPGEYITQLAEILGVSSETLDRELAANRERFEQLARARAIQADATERPDD